MSKQLFHNKFSYWNKNCLKKNKGIVDLIEFNL